MIRLDNLITVVGCFLCDSVTLDDLIIVIMMSVINNSSTNCSFSYITFSCPAKVRLIN